MANTRDDANGNGNELFDEDTGEVYIEGEIESVTRDNYMLLSTLTLKAMGAGGSVAQQIGERVRVARIWGEVNGWDNVEYEGSMLQILNGQFRGLNLMDQQGYEAPVLALPRAFQPTLLKEIQTHGKSFEFFIEIVAMPASNKSGYSYLGRMHLDSIGPDPFASMEKRWNIAAINANTIPPLIRLRSDPTPALILPTPRIANA